MTIYWSNGTKAGVLGIALWAASIAAPAAARSQVSKAVAGEAFGALVNTAAVQQDKAPYVVLNPDSGLVESSLLGLSVGVVSDPISAFGFFMPGIQPSGPDPLKAGKLDASSSGTTGEHATTSQGSSRVKDVNILGGAVTAELVVAQASSAAVNGLKATSSAAGSQILGLSVNGVFMGDVKPAPNTRITVPGVGTVVLNEQIRSGDGITTSGLQVNMVHVVLQDALTGATTGDIIVGSAKSAARYVR